jgi:phosphoribosylpyrophosphate synthetase
LVICTKIREGDKRIVSVKEGEIKNRHVFIIDDLVKTGIATARISSSYLCGVAHPPLNFTGGTLIECKNGLYRLGAAKVSAFVTHPVFPLESWKRFTEVLLPPCLILRLAGLAHTHHVALAPA